MLENSTGFQQVRADNNSFVVHAIQYCRIEAARRYKVLTLTFDPCPTLTKDQTSRLLQADSRPGAESVVRSPLSVPLARGTQ